MLPPSPFAFPSEFCEAPAQQGMTLRDYFAGQALIGIINQSTIAEVANTIMTVAAAKGVTEHYVMAISAYKYADEMLAARERGGA
jgi:hypothetical protein